MTLKEAYESVESNYDNVLKRLGSEGMIKRFAVKFIDDPTFGELKNALAAGDGESAFRAAHTMKGICLNLGFDKLYEVSAALTEQLRGYEITGSEAVYQCVKTIENRAAVHIGNDEWRCSIFYCFYFKQKAGPHL